MKCKGQVVVNYHTNKIVSTSHKTLNPNAILKKLKELEALKNTKSKIEADMQG